LNLHINFFSLRDAFITMWFSHSEIFSMTKRYHGILFPNLIEKFSDVE